LELVITLNLADDERMALYGPADINLRTLREALGVRIYARDSTLKVVGDSEAVGKAAAVIEVLQNRLQQRSHLTREDIAEAVGELAAASRDEPGTIQVYRRSTKIRPKTPGQEAYVQGIEGHDLSSVSVRRARARRIWPWR
jgi:phosphate starvation-inducible PhoH-like protein